MEIQLALPHVKLGLLEAENAQVAPTDGALANLTARLCERKRREFKLETLAEAEPVRAVRALFRAWDLDPSKYRPSSEALLRRVVQGKGLYQISNVVDVGNLGSIETGWPYGCYDRSRISPPVAFRHGLPGERYEGIGKRVWHLEGRPVLADAAGPFGSPISDSTRTMITQLAGSLLAVICAPQSAADARLEEALATFGTRLSRFAGASEIKTRIFR